MPHSALALLAGLLAGAQAYGIAAVPRTGASSCAARLHARASIAMAEERTDLRNIAIGERAVARPHEALGLSYGLSPVAEGPIRVSIPVDARVCSSALLHSRSR